MPEYAAVAITTLNRVEHLKSTIESLLKCTLADFTDVYIAVDYPPNESYWGGYEQVIKYLHSNSFSGFHSFTLIERPVNYGYFKNMSELRAMVMERHDAFITMQDDIECGVHFLEYMNDALLYWKYDDSVVAVSGYSYPLCWNCSTGSNTVLTNYVAAEWGIGFWTEKYKKIDELFRTDYLYRNAIIAYRNRAFDHMIDACIKDYAASILNPYYQDSWLRQICDVSLRIYLAVADKYIGMPIVSHTRNHGFDGSGLFCGKSHNTSEIDVFADNYIYDTQPIDNSTDYKMVPSDNNYFEENRHILNIFDRRDQREMKSIGRKIKAYALFPSAYKMYLLLRTYYRGVRFKIKQLV